MKYKSLRIGDIQTSDVLYYDKEYAEMCFCFCKERDIDCLPSLIDPNKIHVRDEKDRKFSDELVKSGRKVDASEYIFSSWLVGKFTEKRLLLVCESSELVGVVHFSDYAKPAVSIYLYEILFAYENALRKLLERKGYTNESMVEYFQQKIADSTGEDRDFYQDKVTGYYDRQAKNSKLPRFHSFYLSDLVEFAVDKGINIKSEGVIGLRNSIMHAHELVNKKDPNASNLIYDIDSFSKFFKSASRLLTDFKRVNNLLLLLDASPPCLEPS